MGHDLFSDPFSGAESRTKVWSILLEHACVFYPILKVGCHPTVASHGRAWRVMAERLRALDSSSGVWSAECGFGSRLWHLLRKIGEVVLSAPPARLRTNDTQAYICMDCKRANPVSALGVYRWERPLGKKTIVAHTLKWPCVSGNLYTIFFLRHSVYTSLRVESSENFGQTLDVGTCDK